MTALEYGPGFIQDLAYSLPPAAPGLEAGGGVNRNGGLQFNRATIDTGLAALRGYDLGSNVLNATIGAPAAVAVPSVREGVLPNARTKSERIRDPKFSVRESTIGDIPRMVDIDMHAFGSVYEGYGIEADRHRAELVEKFTGRFNMLGGKYMPVVTRPAESGGEEIVGFMTSCPTHKGPEDFVSWEETTNHGKLDTLYDPEGKNGYVVTLSMDPEVRGQRGQNLLFVQQMATMIGEGLDLAYFESRMPGLRNWVQTRCVMKRQPIGDLTEEDKLELAQEYFGLTRIRDGKTVPHDPLLRVYAGAGCKFVSVVPNAYKDEPSMDFGVLCTFENPLPRWVRNSRAMRGLASTALKAFMKSSWLSRKAFG